MKIRKTNVLSTLIALVLVLSLGSTTAFAQGSLLPIPEKSIVTLTDDQGRSSSGEATLVSNIMPRNGDNGVATYAMSLYASDKQLALTEQDGSLAAKITLTLYYSQTSDTTLLKKVGVKWVITDSSVTASDCNILTACSSAMDSIEQHKEFTNVSNGSTKSTGFTKPVHTKAAGTLVGASLSMKFRMGSSRSWNFSMQNNLLDTSM